MAYIGVSPSNGVRRVHTYTATASQTTFSGAGAEGTSLSYKDSNFVDVYQNGIKLGDADYTSTSGTSIVLAQGASVDDLVVVVVFDVFSVADTVSKADGGTFDGNVTMGGTLDVSGAFTSNGIDDNADATAITIDSSEQVGIGTTAMSSYYAKDLVLGASNQGGITITGATTDTGQYIMFADGTSGADRYRGYIQYAHDSNLFVIGTDGAERLRINSSGELSVGSTSTTPAQSNIAGALSFRPTGQLEVSANNTQAAFFNRTTDGTVINIIHEGSSEGTISVSGSTVSYNGGHLARYSRLTNDKKDTSIVKGTVMTNLDEMVVWKHEKKLWTKDDELPDGVSVGDVKKDAYTEDNEQLNKMAVSSVEGDVNVAGVFVNWDNDDDFNDMNVAMTGDMVIRIAKGTTVARGDLLMSAGDGTAKPQDDDIVRSKTIAKVTSTNVSHTYDDGTYLVPCVVMAC